MKREDDKLTKMVVLAMMEKDSTKKAELQKAADEYWAKRRLELGLQEE